MPSHASHGYTALHWACQTGQLEVVKVLLEMGAELECRNSLGIDAAAYGLLCGTRPCRLLSRD